MALYATIWLALALLAVATIGSTRTTAAPAWTLLANRTGAALAILHAAIALGYTYAWNHDRAVSETARRAGEVYGFAWRGSIYVSYAFLIVWAIDAWRARSMTQRLIVRAFFLVIIVNAAIVFASPAGRVLGVLVAACLLWSWRPRLVTKVFLEQRNISFVGLEPHVGEVANEGNRAEDEIDKHVSQHLRDDLTRHAVADAARNERDGNAG